MADPLATQLVAIGFTEKEAKLYVSGLRVGPAPVQRLAREAKVNRATTYVVLQSLIEKGLASHYTQEQKSYYVMEDPAVVDTLLEYEEQGVDRDILRLRETLFELTSIYNLAQDRPKVYFYDGKAGLLQAIADYYGREAALDVYEYFSVDDVLALFPRYQQEHGRRPRGATYRAHVMYTRAAGAFTAAQQREAFQADDEVHYLGSKVALATDVIFDQDRVALLSLRGHLIGLIIENAEIARTQQAIFALVKKGLATHTA